MFVNLQMSIDTMTPGGGRGRGCGRGAPFGNTEQRRELRLNKCQMSLKPKIFNNIHS